MSVLAVAAALVVLLAPAAAEARSPGAGAAGGPAPRRGTGRRWAQDGWGPRGVGLVGRRLRASLGRPPDAVADGCWGTTVVAVGAAAPLGLLSPLLAAVPLVAVAVPPWRSRHQRRRQQHAAEAALPEVLDLISLAIRAGGTPAAAVILAARRGPEPAASALRSILDRAAAGLPLADALDDLPALLGESYRPLASALVAAERDGGPLQTVVAVLSGDAASARRRQREARARAVPVRLLFPLVCCTLPAVLIVTIVPLVLAGGLPG